MHWKPTPWIAAVLGLFVPPLGMLYVRRPLFALGYFLLWLCIGIVAITSAVGFAPATIGTLFGLANWAVAIGCAVHSFAIAKGASAVRDRPWYTRWPALAGIPAVFFAVTLLFRAFLYEPFHIPSESMHPTLPEGTIVFARKLGFGDYGSFGIMLWRSDSVGEIERGDIVIHRLVSDPQTSYITRVIGLPGDHVRYVDRQLVLNGKAVPITLGAVDGLYRYATERIAERDVTIAWIPDRPARDFDQVVPPDHLAVFGDNRDNARDSRYIGTIARQQVVGRVVKIFPPQAGLPGARD